MTIWCFAHVCAQAPCEECVVLTATIKEDKATIDKNKATIKEMGARIEVCVRARARAFA